MNVCSNARMVVVVGLILFGANAHAQATSEDPINGCVSSAAVDLTGAGTNVAISPTFNVPAINKQLDPARMCLQIRSNQTITMRGTGVLGGPLMVGGTVDADGVAQYDKASPIQPSCYNGIAFDPNSAACYKGGVWPCTNIACKGFAAQSYGFYNNSRKDSQKGALYVIK